MTTNEDIERTARQADDVVRRIEEYGASLTGRTHTFPLRNELGTVTLDGRAELLSIDLEPRRLRTTRPDALASAVVAAVQEAEATVRRRVAEETAQMVEGGS